MFPQIYSNTSVIFTMSKIQYSTSYSSSGYSMTTNEKGEGKEKKRKKKKPLWDLSPWEKAGISSLGTIYACCDFLCTVSIAWKSLHQIWPSSEDSVWVSENHFAHSSASRYPHWVMNNSQHVSKPASLWHFFRIFLARESFPTTIILDSGNILEKDILPTEQSFFVCLFLRRGQPKLSSLYIEICK